jgi:hypothetical protein
VCILTCLKITNWPIYLWVRPSQCGWDVALYMRCSRVVRANYSRNCPGFDPSILHTVESEGRQIKQCWISYIKSCPTVSSNSSSQDRQCAFCVAETCQFSSLFYPLWTRPAVSILHTQQLKLLLQTYSNAVGGRELGGGGGGEEGDTEIPDEFRKITTKYLLISLAKIA